MPELPEVQTTVNGLAKTVVGLKIIDAWSDYDSRHFKGSDTIKDAAYFARFRKEVVGRKIVAVTRRAKNILMTLDNGGTVLVHMKMTGHLLYGKYAFNPRLKKDPWEPIEPESLKDPFNRRVHFLLSFGNGRHLALSDTRKFGKVTFIPADTMHASGHLKNIGPEPLDASFTFTKFRTRLMLRPEGRIKQVILDQSIIAGIGNIYGDESLWRAGIHPMERIKNVSPEKLRTLFRAIKLTLSKGIDFGGDSMSDYRNVHGEKGAFQEHHGAYRRTGKRCGKPACGGTIVRTVVGGRGTHHCDRHQKLIGKC